MIKLCLLLTLGLLVAPPARAETPLPVVASFSILGDMVKEVGGSHVAVTTLVGPNGDTHAYEPTPQDVKNLSKAKILIINGLGFEGWIERLDQASSFMGRTVVTSDGVQPRRLKPNELRAAKGNIYDPHAWQDLSNGVIYVRNIAMALEKALPTHAGEIGTRAEDYIKRIQEMDSKVRAEIAAIPTTRRRIITTHDAFGYFGTAYDVEFLAPVGLSSGAEPSARALATLLRTMKKTGIKTVFLENMENPRIAKQLAKDGNAKLGEPLFSDALSPANGPATSYLGMFENNVPKLIAAMKENDAG